MDNGANTVLITSLRLLFHYRYPDSVKVGRNFIILMILLLQKNDFDVKPNLLSAVIN